MPRVLEISGERRAREMLENIEVSSFPHITDKQVKEAIIKFYRDRLPKPPPEPPKSAQEQYKELKLRMMGRG